MPEGEQAPEPPFDDPVTENTTDDATDDAKGQFVFDVIDEDRAFRMRLHAVPVSPAPEGPSNLLILKGMRRVVRGVDRLPPDENAGCNAGIDGGAAPDVQIGRDLDDPGPLPRRQEHRERIGALVKGEERLRRRVDDACGGKSHVRRRERDEGWLVAVPRVELGT